MKRFFFFLESIENKVRSKGQERKGNRNKRQCIEKVLQGTRAMKGETDKWQGKGQGTGDK